MSAPLWRGSASSGVLERVLATAADGIGDAAGKASSASAPVTPQDPGPDKFGLASWAASFGFGTEALDGSHTSPAPRPFASCKPKVDLASTAATPGSGSRGSTPPRRRCRFRSNGRKVACCWGGGLWGWSWIVGPCNIARLALLGKHSGLACGGIECSNPLRT